ncbi:hypothetical protein MTYP_01973 [Methylophilaceae bacterium]|nr:hypothetical protein MTYP_01973 [Methylophilaceae bacterium]
MDILKLMAKIILIAIAIWLILTVLKRYRKNIDTHPDTGNSRTPASESMVQCSHCGLHLPESDGIRSGTQFYCCQEHADAQQDERNH